MKGVNQQLFEKFGIKPCVVKLDNNNFKKINMRCFISTSEPNENFICNMVQTDINSFNIRIKRKLVEVVHNSMVSKPAKRVKFDEGIIARTAHEHERKSSSKLCEPAISDCRWL